MCKVKFEFEFILQHHLSISTPCMALSHDNTFRFVGPLYGEYIGQDLTLETSPRSVDRDAFTLICRHCYLLWILGRVGMGRSTIHYSMVPLRHGYFPKLFTINTHSTGRAGYMAYFVQSLICVLWWRHQMETFSALLAICAGNSPVPGEFPSQRPVTQSFDVFFDRRRIKRLNKQSWGWWFETLSRPI